MWQGQEGIVAVVLLQGDAFRIPLRTSSMHCCITSPPYWGLRKYAGEQGQEPLGLEPTPERHIERTVEWAREIYRVLRDDGVFWLNYGDCYDSGGLSDSSKVGGFTGARIRAGKKGIMDSRKRNITIGQGNLMLMPHRVALALQADGWIVRQDLVWAKPNPMPESVNGWRWQRERTKLDRSEHAKKHNIKGGTEAMLRDASIHQGIGPDWIPEYEYGDDYELRRGSWRHTRAHEYVFMLVKGMGYWADQEAVRETASDNTHSRGIKRDPPIDHAGQGHTDWVAYMDRDAEIAASGRNPLSVLNIPTSPDKGAHYATFPPNLIAPLIQATCPRWCCPVCGQGWAPVVEQSYQSSTYGDSTRPDIAGSNDQKEGSSEGPYFAERMRLNSNVMGHRPTCDHPHTQAEAVPGVVFDPFVGSGTTVMVARQLLRKGIGLDISRPYIEDQAILRIGEIPTDQKLEDLPLFRDNGRG